MSGRALLGWLGKRRAPEDTKVVTFGPTVSNPPMEPPHRLVLERVLALEERVAALEEKERQRG